MAKIVTRYVQRQLSISVHLLWMSLSWCQHTSQSIYNSALWQKAAASSCCILYSLWTTKIIEETYTKKNDNSKKKNNTDHHHHQLSLMLSLLTITMTTTTEMICCYVLLGLSKLYAWAIWRKKSAQLWTLTDLQPCKLFCFIKSVAENQKIKWNNKNQRWPFISLPDMAV